ncbi:MAG TPA: DUF1460 domain-containing protein, partial [Candidatus Sumerlaeota bacterium]|nr:DUF1460 domain-containing protein [Candidatus Sumerlaeota bacterium]
KQASPWDGVEAKYPVKSRHTGEVVNVMTYGAFVKLEPGIEGLVHISEMSWTKRINHPNEMVHIGDKIEVEVLNINKDKQEISLGMKQCHTNPWDKVAEIEDQLQEGDFVNVMRSSGSPAEAYAGHVGLIVKGPNGETHFLHSTEPRVKEQPLSEYIANARKWADTEAKPGQAKLMGFKFLRLEKDPIANLKKIDGPDAPKVTPPGLSKVAAAGN